MNSRYSLERHDYIHEDGVRKHADALDLPERFSPTYSNSSDAREHQAAEHKERYLTERRGARIILVPATRINP